MAPKGISDKMDPISCSVRKDTYPSVVTRGLLDLTGLLDLIGLLGLIRRSQDGARNGGGMEREMEGKMERELRGKWRGN